MELYDGCRRSKRAQHESILTKLRSEALVAPESTYFSPPAPVWHSSPGSFLDNADAINLHWVSDYLSPRDLGTLFRSGKPVVWTLHDARAFTGGCHYPGECLQFQWTCSSCPQLHPPFRPLADAGFEVQRGLFEGVKMPTFVTPSAWLGRLAASSPLLSGARVEVIPNSLDLDVFKPRSDDEFRSLMGWKREALVILFGSHSIRDKRKGVDLVLDAIERCTQQRDIKEMVETGQLVFACFGEAPDLQSKSALPVCMLGSFEGEENAARTYQAADVFICASREDNLPNTVMEAMACGLAVIGTKAGGIPEMIDDERTGRLVPVADAASLADGLLDLIRNKNKIHGMGLSSRIKCKKHYTTSRQASSYVNLFEDIAEQHRNKPVTVQPWNNSQGSKAERRVANTLNSFKVSPFQERILFGIADRCTRYLARWFPARRI